MRNASKTRILLASIAAMSAVLAAPITSAFAGPVPSTAIAVKTAAPDAVQDVQWRRRGGAAIVTGLAAGAIGAAVFAPRYHGYGPAYGYAPAYGYYDGPYAYEGPPVGYAPAYGYYDAPYAYEGPPVASYGYGYGPAYYGDTRTRQQRQRDRSHGN
jgi:hypothetical protein